MKDKEGNGIPIKLQGINAWFIIEILSFYGYIISAIWFIMENSIKSTFGWLNKTNLTERYKTDFIVFHRSEIDWLAFLSIMLLVNTGLIAIEELVILEGIPKEDRGEQALRPLMYQLLANHVLHFLFKRKFLDDERKVNSAHKWLWVVSFASYTYIIYMYYFTDICTRSNSDYMKSWIPLDIMLMVLVAIYYFFSKMMQAVEEECIQEDLAINNS
jgi:hypothetical protein